MQRYQAKMIKIHTRIVKLKRIHIKNNAELIVWVIWLKWFYRTDYTLISFNKLLKARTTQSKDNKITNLHKYFNIKLKVNDNRTNRITSHSNINDNNW